MAIEHPLEVPNDERIPPVDELLDAIEREEYQNEGGLLQSFAPWMQLKAVLRSHRLVAHEDHVGPPSAANDG
jgi:hypothetical protein